MNLVIAGILGIIVSIVIAWLLSLIAFRCTTKRWPSFRHPKLIKASIGKRKARKRNKGKYLVYLRGVNSNRLIVTKREIPGMARN